jgi:phage portal protein BeeE
MLSNMRKVVVALSRVARMQNFYTQSISPQTKVLIEKLLAGKFTLLEIAKVTGISEQLLHSYLND